MPEANKSLEQGVREVASDVATLIDTGSRIVERASAFKGLLGRPSEARATIASLLGALPRKGS